MKKLLAFVLCFWSLTAASADLADTVAAVKRSVVGVGVHAGDGTSPRLLGNGFVSGGNHVVTTAGVVGARAGAGDLAVFVPAGGSRAQVRPVRVVSRDAEHDLALLRFEGPPLPSLRLGRSGDVREGELLAYTGLPNAGVVGLTAVTHRGIVSAISPNVVLPVSGRLVNLDVLEKLTRPYPVFQLDMSAFPGNSGSPLYEPDSGRVVGVINSPFVKATKELSIPGSSAISYAVPVDHVRRLLHASGVAY